MRINKHKVFVSFYHQDDQDYKNYIDKNFGHLIINESVMNGEYDADNSDEYIKRLIREEKITNSSVIVVLVGRNTKKRKHVDWEIYAGLRESINGRAGLIGVYLPTIEDLPYKEDYIPGRLKDNVDSGYAKMYNWDIFIKRFSYIIDSAFDSRVNSNLVNNARKQMQRNK
jgi:hypothetical protein